MIDNRQIREESIKSKLKNYITKQFLYDDENASLANDFGLVEQGVINSMGIAILITFLEEEFDVLFAPEDMVLENFATIDAITAYAMRKSEASGAMVKTI